MQDVNLASKPVRKGNDLLSVTKAKLPPYDGGVVYAIPCRDPKHLYIGETGRYLRTRLGEHQADAHNIVKKMNESACIDALTRTRQGAKERE